MGRIVYVNGAYVPEEAAQVSVFDRGFVMADAVYEVTSVLDGKLIDFAGHMARLHRSLDALGLPEPAGDDEMLAIHREMVARNGLVEGGIYLQVTRGAADRDFTWEEGMAPTMVLFTQARGLAAMPAPLRVITLPDIRWGRRDIKTVQLLAPSLAKMQARAAGKDDAWMVEDGFVTEGTSNNAHIVLPDGTLVTRPLSNEILHGITRAAVLQLAREAQITVVERPFTVAEAQGAAEAFVTSATAFVRPVVEIDGVSVGTGAVGPLATRLREIYVAESLKRAI